MTRKRFPLLDSDVLQAKWASSKPAKDPALELEQREATAALLAAIARIPDEEARIALLASCDFPEAREQVALWQRPRQTLRWLYKKAIRLVRRQLQFGKR